ncbi:hypothetical protein [Myroides sp. C4067]|uniref:hypothetical protein n=2 Tax=Flavobacteriaceae TaxID=49546 RepID=UPI000280A542|nr:hypothetical protein BK054_02745 [Myroides sp. ZB35]EKB02498.1 hypothetical protein HMPREF9711_03283 [Myroides odoratimimus CCUG 3837]SHM50659.1 hypothetical protein SAMN05444275_11482 [Myroides odoratimimus subsp. xuanwuensis]
MRNMLILIFILISVFCLGQIPTDWQVDGLKGKVKNMEIVMNGVGESACFEEVNVYNEEGYYLSKKMSVLDEKAPDVAMFLNMMENYEPYKGNKRITISFLGDKVEIAKGTEEWQSDSIRVNISKGISWGESSEEKEVLINITTETFNGKGLLVKSLYEDEFSSSTDLPGKRLETVNTFNTEGYLTSLRVNDLNKNTSTELKVVNVELDIKGNVTVQEHYEDDVLVLNKTFTYEYYD